MKLVGENVTPNARAVNTCTLPHYHGLHWCEDCCGYTSISREGTCAVCGSRAVAPKRPVRCTLCGGGVDEGEIIGGLVHRTCIPTYIRRRGEVVVEEFVKGLHSWKVEA